MAQLACEEGDLGRAAVWGCGAAENGECGHCSNAGDVWLELDYPKPLLFPAWVPDLAPVWMNSSVSPGISSSGIAPEPTSSSQQCVFASQVFVITDSTRAMGAAVRVPMGWGTDTPKSCVWGRQSQLQVWRGSKPGEAINPLCC